MFVIIGLVTARDYFARWARLPELYMAYDVYALELIEQMASERDPSAVCRRRNRVRESMCAPRPRAASPPRARVDCRRGSSLLGKSRKRPADVFELSVDFLVVNLVDGRVCLLRPLGRLRRDDAWARPIVAPRPIGRHTCRAETGRRRAGLRVRPHSACGSMATPTACACKKH